MASVKITINGVICDLYGRTISGPVKIVGEAMYSDLGVGGGPIYPEPPPSGGDGKPPGIWGGPIDPYPGHPLPEPPGKPIVPPPNIWPPGPGIDFPSHPIVIPPPVDPDKPPNIPPGSLITWKPIWTPSQGWQIVGIPNVPHPAPSA